MTSNPFKGPNAAKSTLKELESLERRLNIVYEGCLSKEELEARKNNKFENDKKRLVEMLQKINSVCDYLICQ